MKKITAALIAAMCAVSTLPIIIESANGDSAPEGISNEETLSDENRIGETVSEEIKTEEPVSEETKNEETVSEEIKNEETASEETKNGDSDSKETGDIVIENQVIDVPLNGSKWIKVNGVFYYVKDGEPVKGLYEFTESDGESAPHLSYFDDKGCLVTNNVFDIGNEEYIADDNGWAKKVESEHDKTLARAYRLVDEWTDKGMTKEEKFRICYDHIRDDFPEYNPRIPHYAGEGWDTTYANDIFVDKGGNCISVAAAVAYVAKAIGFKDVYAVNGGSHGWAEVDNLVYDAEWERHNDGSYFGLSYDVSGDGLPVYKYIFGSDNPYARIKL